MATLQLFFFSRVGLRTYQHPCNEATQYAPRGSYVKFTLAQAMKTQSVVGVELYSFFNL